MIGNLEMTNKKNLSNIMDFKNKVKNTSFKGRPLNKGNLTKTYKKYVLTENRNAPLPSGLVVYNNKIIKRSKLEDKRSKSGALKPSVIKNLQKTKSSKTITKFIKRSNPLLNISSGNENPRYGSKDFKIKVKNVDKVNYTKEKVFRSLYRQTKDQRTKFSRFVFDRPNTKTFSVPFSDFSEMNENQFIDYMIQKTNQTAEEHYDLNDEGVSNSSITLQTNYIPSGMGGYKVPEWLKGRNALFNIINDDGLCGQRCLAVSIQNKTGIKNLRKKTRTKQLDRLTKEMVDKLGINKPLNILDFEVFAKKFKRQVIIFSSRKDIIHHTDDFREDKDDQDKIVYIYLDRTNEHYHLITNVNVFVSTNTQRYKYCPFCMKSYDIRTFKTHKCKKDKCRCCNSYEGHKGAKKWVNCQICNRWCFNEECRMLHIAEYHTYKKANKLKSVEVGDTKDATDWYCCKCKTNVDINRHQLGQHICGECKCDNCGEFHLPEDNHRCNILRGNITTKSTGEDMNYYAFDFESEFLDDGIHKVNFVDVRLLYSNERYQFNSIEDFIDFTKTQKKSTFIAHNFKGYDGWLIHNHLKREIGKKPNRIVLAGQKIMYMEFDGVRFIDSLNFVALPLEKLPKTFGLNQDQFKKGFFPYKMNKQKYKNYIGLFPEKHFFEPEKMKVSKEHQEGVVCPNKSKCKYCEFNKWYDSNKHTTYNFKKELKEYCESDVDILTKSMEVFRDNMMDICEGLDPLMCITIASYAHKVYLTLHAPTEEELDEIEGYNQENDYREEQTAISVLKKEEYLKMKKGFFGGRTEVFRLYKSWSKEEIDNGIYGRYIDIKSLYPTVQFYDYLPYGKPKKFTFDAGEKPDISKYFGFVECDITPPKDLLVPLLGGKSNGKFCFGLDKMEKAVVPTPELMKALELGYKIDRVYEIYHFKKSKELFKSYIRTFMRLKEEAGYEGKEEDKEEYCRMWKEEIGIDLKPEKLIYNAGKKSCSKVCLNSLWGKFGQRVMDTSEYIEDPSKWYKLMRRHEKGEVIIKTREDMGDTLFITYQENNEKKTSLKKTNVALCGMLTSNARLRLYEVIGKMGKRLIYCDTDSAIYEYNKNLYNPKEGDMLGDWQPEEQEPITDIVAPAPKTYAYKTLSQKKEVKSKGLTFNEENSKCIHFEAYKELIDTRKKLKAKALIFKKTKEGMKTLTTDKDLSFEADKFKRVINFEDYTTTPFGYEV